MAYPIGTVLNGKVWSGENYGWQSRATHNKLKEQGKFRFGTQALDRVGSSLKRLLPAPIKQAAKAVQSHMAENDRRVAARDAQTPVGRYFINPTKAVTQAPAKVQQSLVNKASEVTNVDPRIVGVAAEVGTDFLLGKAGALRGVPRAAAPTPLVTRQSRGGGIQRGIQRQVQASRAVPVGEVGGIYPAGHPKAGTYKLPKPHAHQDLLEQQLEAAHQHFNKNGSLKGFNTLVELPDGTVKRISNKGNVKFENRVGLSAVDAPSKPAKPNPVPDVSTKVQAPAPIPPTTNKSPDLAQRRFTPLDKDPSIKESRSQIDKRVRNPALPRDLAPGKGPSDTAPPVPLGELARDMGKDSPTRGQLTIGPYEPGTAKAGQAYANAHLSVDGSGVALPFKVAETQAHHSTSPLKDAGDFTRGFNDEQMAIFRAKTEAAGVYAGDTQLNTAYLRQPYHQGNKVWPEAKQSAVHPNLQSRVLEAKASQDRWAHMTPEQRLENIDYFIEDALLGQRLAQEAEFSQTLLQAGNNAFDNPFGGNLSQSVLAPLNKQNLRQISKKRQDARQVLRRLPTNGQIAKDAALNNGP
jgi:hypothetical protein